MRAASSVAGAEPILICVSMQLASSLATTKREVPLLSGRAPDLAEDEVQKAVELVEGGVADRDFAFAAFFADFDTRAQLAREAIFEIADRCALLRVDALAAVLLFGAD